MLFSIVAVDALSNDSRCFLREIQVMSEQVNELRNLLFNRPNGKITDAGTINELVDILVHCWDDFDGSDNEGMAAYKLVDRMEEVEWCAPHLMFTIECHGAGINPRNASFLDGRPRSHDRYI